MDKIVEEAKKKAINKQWINRNTPQDTLPSWEVRCDHNHYLTGLCYRERLNQILKVELNVFKLL